MADHDESNRLFLPDLRITGFRGIDNLEIPRLGRVTLLAGRNGVGKTTVLEAIRVYAARGRPVALNALLEQRDEFASSRDEDNDPVLAPDYSALFHGRVVRRGESIQIGPYDQLDSLRIEVSKPSGWRQDQLDLFRDLLRDPASSVDLQALKIIFRQREMLLPWLFATDDFQSYRTKAPLSSRVRHRRLDDEWPPPIKCESLGPGLLSNQRLASLWNEVALTEDEDRATEALRIVRGNAIERVAIVGEDRAAYRMRTGQRVMVKLADTSTPVPLKSLGDGATRVFGVALALANSRNGFLVIDEAENGIHYLVQRDFWRMVLTIARWNNVQVLASTHSWDCVRGFAQAAMEDEESEGLLARLERRGGDIAAIAYSEAELETAADQLIEVR
jgi:hypothetical protein